jgi:CRP-like cAMP-binding protein
VIAGFICVRNQHDINFRNLSLCLFFLNSDFLGQIDFLKTLPEEVLSTVANECLLRDLEKGEVLFEDGEEGSSMFITLSGKLVVWKNDLEIARHVAAG